MLTGITVNAQDKTKWTQVRQNFAQKYQSKIPAMRIEIISELVNGIYPEVEEEAVDLIIKQITNEISLGGSPAREINVNNTVLEKCINGLKKISNEKAVDKIIKTVKDNTLHWRVRFYLLKGISGINNPNVISTLLELILDKDARIKIGVFNALGELKSKEGTEEAFKLINSEVTWEIKIAAIQYLSNLNGQSLIEPLIHLLENKTIEGRLRGEIAGVLNQLTRKNIGLQGSAWREWWNKKNKVKQSGNQPEETITVTTVYYGIKEPSKRIIFILDISPSMQWGAELVEDPEADKTQPTPKFINTDGKPVDEKLVKELQSKKEIINKRPVTKRLEAAKRELVNTIYHLDSSVYFTIIFFSTPVTLWKESLIPATADNKIAAMKEIEKQNCGNGTATFDALETAYKITEQKNGEGKKIILDKKGYIIEQMNGADTIFLVTDGSPTAGRITTSKEIVNELGKFNETRKIKINTVAVGSEKGVPPDALQKWGAKICFPDILFLKDLSDLTNGAFVDKTNQ
jgi:hypothetical protein